MSEDVTRSPRQRALRALGVALPIALIAQLAGPLDQPLLAALPLFGVLPAVLLGDLDAARAAPGRSLAALGLALTAEAIGLAVGFAFTVTILLAALALIPILARPLWLLAAARVYRPVQRWPLALLGLALITVPLGYMGGVGRLALLAQAAESGAVDPRSWILRPEWFYAPSLLLCAPLLAWLTASSSE
ncbi:MAG: hypothetical protein H6741_32085 [Alphaproteobacteria bacterium]|nr:hypothetical protein [Alphaproteobacteria bacterium]